MTKPVAMKTPNIQIVVSKSHFSLKELGIRDMANYRSGEKMYKISLKGLVSESKGFIKDQ